MKTWMTGENGFLARAFVRHLSHKHTVENRFDNDFYDYWRQNKFSPEHYPEIDIFDPTLKTLVERSGADCIIHTATMINYQSGKEHWMIRNNIEGSYYVAQVAKDLDIPIIFISYINHENQMFDWTQKSILEMFNNLGIQYINICTEELFGPEDLHGSISQLLMSSIGKLDVAEIYANIEKSKHYTFIDDFLDGLDMILDNILPYIHSNIVIKNKQKRTLENVIDYMSDKMEIDIHYDIKEISTEYINKNIEIKNLQNWECKYSFEAALEITRDMMNVR